MATTPDSPTGTSFRPQGKSSRNLAMLELSGQGVKKTTSQNVVINFKWLPHCKITCALTHTHAHISRATASGYGCRLGGASPDNRSISNSRTSPKAQFITLLPLKGSDPLSCLILQQPVRKAPSPHFAHEQGQAFYMTCSRPVMATRLGPEIKSPASCRLPQ